MRQDLAVLDVVEDDEHDRSADQKYCSYGCKKGDAPWDGKKREWAAGRKAGAWYRWIPV